MKLKISFFIALYFALINNTFAWFVYPIQTMSKVECRFQNYSTLWSDCKMQLPILKTSDYSKYKNDYSLYRRVYTVLWWSSYTYGWDVWNGWHSWVDIATAKWTPVYAMNDWKVLVAWVLSWRWNSIKIEHTVNWKKIYSTYNHLSAINVSVWQSVKASDVIWEVWSTWNSTWNHLHFQIDVTNWFSWPRYRTKCSEKNYNTIINSNVCFSELNTNTVDPLLFLETSGAIIKSTWVVEKPKTETISKTWLISNEEIQKREIDDFLKNYKVELKSPWIWWNIIFWQKSTLKIQVTERKTWKLFNWSFPGEMTFKSNGLNIFPTWVLAIDNGYREISVTPKSTWRQSIDIYIWTVKIQTLNLWVFDISKTILVRFASVLVDKMNVIWQIKKSIIVFQDNNSLNLVWVKYDWKYRISSTNNNVKFCIKKVDNLANLSYIYNKNCDETSFVDSQEFSYNDTVMWILLYEYKVIKDWVNTIIVDKVWASNITKTQVSWNLPLWIDKKYSYYNELIEVAELWILPWVNNGYYLQDRSLSQSDAVDLIYWSLVVLKSRCKDTACMVAYDKMFPKVAQITKDKYKNITRKEFVELINQNIVLKDYSGDAIKFRDIDANLQVIVSKIMKNNTWRDKFWETRYFQPTKELTRWEWAYLIYNVLN